LAAKCAKNAKWSNYFIPVPLLTGTQLAMLFGKPRHIAN